MQLVNRVSLFVVICFPFLVQANKCGEFVYNKKGMLRKYEYLNLSLSEGTKKHGSSSTSGVSTESSTASSDPGVTTGQTVGASQSLSSWGDCKFDPTALMTFGSRSEYKEYIVQNFAELKNEMSLGGGGHLQLLASAHVCPYQAFGKSSQQDFLKVVDLKENESDYFVDALNQVAKQACPDSGVRTF